MHRHTNTVNEITGNCDKELPLGRQEDLWEQAITLSMEALVDAIEMIET